MNVKQAAQQILAQAGTPMNATDLATAMIAQNLWTTSGKTPGATVSAALSSDIKEKGQTSCFIHAGPNRFGLNPSVQQLQPDPTAPSEPVITKPSEPATMSFGKAAHTVLAQHGKPLHYQQITDIAHSIGLIVTQGLTPAATMSARLSTSIKNAADSGEKSEFVALGKGIYGLRVWEGHSLLDDIDKHNKQVRAQLLDHIKQIAPKDFEILISVLLIKMGFEAVEVTAFSGDGGIDVKGIMEIGGSLKVAMAVQAKRWANNVHAPVVCSLRGSLAVNQRGLLITTSGFSAGAVAEAELPDRVQIGLIDGETLVSLLAEHNIGVTHKEVRVLELNTSNLLES